MRIPPVTIVLALLAFLADHPSLASADDDWAAFANSTYSYCDAKVLAAYWKVEVDQAKARIGAQVRQGTPRTVDLSLQKARKKLKGRARVTCDYWETRYSYEDAGALASAWGVDVSEAKARIGREVTLGRQARLDDKLRSLGRTPGQADPTEAALNAFWSSGLAYCDAELVATLWGVDVYETKKTLGNKIVQGWTDLLDSELARARDNARTTGQQCEFWATPYTPDDAAALAGFWGIELEAAKARMAATYTAGGAKALAGPLSTARGDR